MLTVLHFRKINRGNNHGMSNPRKRNNSKNCNHSIPKHCNTIRNKSGDHIMPNHFLRNRIKE